MAEFLFSIDKSIFHLCNQTLSNPLFDVLMPLFTDWNKSWIGWALVGSMWLLLFWKGGKRGRIVGISLILLVGISDHISSSTLKPIFTRPRPCHLIGGTSFVENIHLLVPCGSGYSFPSSHAVNNFALVTFLTYFYRKWKWIFFCYAVLIGFSRISVGVHFPSDVIGGAVIGILLAYVFIIILLQLSKWLPFLASLSFSAQIEQNEN